MTIKWSQPNDLWYQKTVYPESGTPIFTYHFKNKNENPSKVIEINTKLAKHLCGYELLKKDLANIENFYKDLQEILSNENLRTRTSIQKSVVRSIVITYGKCFAQADSRTIKLEETAIPNEFKELHRYLLEMRNKYVAHAGESSHESCKYVLVIPPLTSIKYAEDIPYAAFIQIHQAVNIKIIFKEDFSFLCLIKKLLDFVNAKIVLLEKKVIDELQSNFKSYFCNLEPNKN